ncbi:MULTISPECIES: hypothetical protein [Heyndrickxia]|nr:hypothetical protein [Heyndrickxia coagulans]KYC65172.1 hypothetical protein B4100_2238 [Heyndrickxia coagulans]MDT9756793.1 hypothetical protein [Heyndrickxia coagulans]MED4346146.1 hypothetical protein [Heyndrickxia coagulans]UJZ86919.1 hypothetical protein L3V65_11755 [Heyndrickxia coagulans]
MGKIPELENVYATDFAPRPAKTFTVCLSGRGDKDREAASRLFGGENNG